MTAHRGGESRSAVHPAGQPPEGRSGEHTLRSHNTKTLMIFLEKKTNIILYELKGLSCTTSNATRIYTAA